MTVLGPLPKDRCIRCGRSAAGHREKEDPFKGWCDTCYFVTLISEDELRQECGMSSLLVPVPPKPLAPDGRFNKE